MQKSTDVTLGSLVPQAALTRQTLNPWRPDEVVVDSLRRSANHPNQRQSEAHQATDEPSLEAPRCLPRLQKCMCPPAFRAQIQKVDPSLSSRFLPNEERPANARCERTFAPYGAAPLCAWSRC